MGADVTRATLTVPGPTAWHWCQEGHRSRAGDQAMPSTHSPWHPPHTLSHRARNRWDPMALAWGDGENYVAWIKIRQKIAFWKLQAACSTMAMSSRTVLDGRSVCVSSQAKCPPRLSSGLTDDFLEFPISYTRRKKLLTRLRSKIIKFAKLEIPLFV